MKVLKILSTCLLAIYAKTLPKNKCLQNKYLESMTIDSKTPDSPKSLQIIKKDWNKDDLDYIETQARWSNPLHNPITYMYIKNEHTPEKWKNDTGERDLMRHFDAAFNIWESTGHVKFRKVTSEKEAEIKIRFEPESHFLENDETHTSTLAHAHYPKKDLSRIGETGFDHEQVQGDIHFNNDKEWVLDDADNESPYSVFSVMVHEIGHTIGIKHIEGAPGDENSIMYPTTVTFPSDTAELNSKEISAIENIYGKHIVTPEILELRSEVNDLKSKLEAQVEHVEKFNPSLEKDYIRMYGLSLRMKFNEAKDKKRSHKILELRSELDDLKSKLEAQVEHVEKFNPSLEKDYIRMKFNEAKDKKRLSHKITYPPGSAIAYQSNHSNESNHTLYCLDSLENNWILKADDKWQYVTFFTKQKHPKNQQCNWQIQAFNGKSIQLFIYKVNVGEDSDSDSVSSCTNDYFIFYEDDNSTKLKSSDKYCINKDFNERSLISRREMVNVGFRSDGEKEVLSGMKLFFRAVDMGIDDNLSVEEKDLVGKYEISE